MEVRGVEIAIERPRVQRSSTCLDQIRRREWVSNRRLADSVGEGGRALLGPQFSRHLAAESIELRMASESVGLS